MNAVAPESLKGFQPNIIYTLISCGHKLVMFKSQGRKIFSKMQFNWLGCVLCGYTTLGERGQKSKFM